MRTKIDKALASYLRRMGGRGVIARAMRYSVFSGGKRIRPIITIAAAKACGGGMKEALPAACAIELIHSYSLVHDDLPAMDDDDFRRGRPTCHRVFGEANAILAGDALLTLAFGVAAKGYKTEKGRLIILELADAAGAFGMVGGQALDLASKTKIRPGGVSSVDLLKTARLFEAAAKCGAIAAGANKKKIEALTQYGRSIGMAFQITDDIIDCEGVRTGKTAARFIDKAKAALGVLDNRAPALSEIADYIAKRTK